MRRLVTAAVLVAALCGSGGAGAADISGGGFIFLGIGDLRTLQGWDLPARFEGTVKVNFQSGFGTGHTVWSPGQPAQLTIAKLKTRNGIRYTALLASTGSHGVTARVDRPGGLCTDVQSNLFDIAAT